MTNTLKIVWPNCKLPLLIFRDFFLLAYYRIVDSLRSVALSVNLPIHLEKLIFLFACDHACCAWTLWYPKWKKLNSLSGDKRDFGFVINFLGWWKSLRRDQNDKNSRVCHRWVRASSQESYYHKIITPPAPNTITRSLNPSGRERIQRETNATENKNTSCTSQEIQSFDQSLKCFSRSETRV